MQSGGHAAEGLPTKVACSRVADDSEGRVTSQSCIMFLVHRGRDYAWDLQLLQCKALGDEIDRARLPSW